MNFWYNVKVIISFKWFCWKKFRTHVWGETCEVFRQTNGFDTEILEKRSCQNCNEEEYYEYSEYSSGITQWDDEDD